MGVNQSQSCFWIVSGRDAALLCVFHSRAASLWLLDLKRFKKNNNNSTKLRPVRKKTWSWTTTKSAWWFFITPSEKYAQVKLDRTSPRFRGENEKSLKPPPRNWITTTWQSSHPFTLTIWFRCFNRFNVHKLLSHQNFACTMPHTWFQ